MGGVPDIVRPTPTPPTLYPSPQGGGKSRALRHLKKRRVVYSLALCMSCVNQTAGFGEGGAERRVGNHLDVAEYRLFD